MLFWCSNLVVQAAADPGDPVQYDELEIAPALETATHYRSNVYLVEENAASGEPITPGTYLQVNPTLGVHIEGRDNEIELGAGYAARRYFQSDLASLNQYRDVDLSADLRMFKRSKIGLVLRDQLSDRGYDSSSDSVEDGRFQHFRNVTSGRVVLRLTPELEVDVGGNANLDTYSNPVDNLVAGVVSADQNNRSGFGPAAEVRWNFLSKMTGVVNTEAEWFDWQENIVASSSESSGGSYGDYLGIPDGRAVALETGVRVRPTPKIFVNALVGYGSAVYDEDSVLSSSSSTLAASQELDPAADGFDTDFRGALVTLEGTYTPAQTQRLTVGYRKDVQDVYFTNFVDYHRVFGSYSGVFLDRYEASAEVNYRLDRYGGEVERLDHRVLTSMDLGYVSMRYVDVRAGMGWQRRSSADQAHPEIEYTDLDVHASVTVTY